MNPRLLAPRLLLDALDVHPHAEAWRDACAHLDTLAAKALPDIVQRPVETPFLVGGDAGARITYEGPPPFEHVFEYVDAAAQGWSHDDPAGPYRAQAAARPDPDLSAYLGALAELCSTWNLRRRRHGTLIAYAHLHTALEGDVTAGQAALDRVANPSIATPDQRAEADREAGGSWIRRPAVVTAATAPATVGGYLPRPVLVLLIHPHRSRLDCRRRRGRSRIGGVA